MNEIGNTILSTEEAKAKYDETLKELLANKQFLARIIKRFVPEFAPYPLDEIEASYIEAGSISVSKVGVARNRTNIEGISNEDTSLNEGSVYYDIIFRVSYPAGNGAYIGMYINLEAQNAYYNGYPIEMRGFYYAARRLGSQLKSINNQTNYGCLEKVYSIWICMGDVPNYEANTATMYYTEKRDVIGYVKRDPGEYDLMNVIILRVNDKVPATDNVLSLLQVICSNLLDKRQKLEQIQQYGIRIDDQLEKGVGRMCNISDMIEARAIAQGEAQGIAQGITQGIAQGITQGIAQGIAQGITQGEAIGRLAAQKESVLEMLHDGLPYETIARYAKIPIETIGQWAQEARLH